MKMKYKIWLKNILLAYVLITVGFALGRQSLNRPDQLDRSERSERSARSARSGKDSAGQVIEDLPPVQVYSVYMTFRCIDCSMIQTLTEQLLESEFAGELERGEIIYQTRDYMKDFAFPARYNISTSTVVVVYSGSRAADGVDGAEPEYERLDEVWTQLSEPDKLTDTIRQAILRALTARDRNLKGQLS